ncbi:hypothetical protein NE237_003250 [Protea cynaroides]|uniref:Uncharacterized protein n=1 Tax=Protea cynaroides TaxID=273540 RepID=A0A9Q0KGP6_9MAGN|nr:hypothetical protein NE237_003250 [Protea cynaroides]
MPFAFVSSSEVTGLESFGRPFVCEEPLLERDQCVSLKHNSRFCSSRISELSISFLFFFTFLFSFSFSCFSCLCSSTICRIPHCYFSERISVQFDGKQVLLWTDRGIPGEVLRICAELLLNEKTDEWHQCSFMPCE